MRKNIEVAAIQFLEEAEHDVEKSDRALEEDEDHADCDSADRGVTCRQTVIPVSRDIEPHVTSGYAKRVGFDNFSKKGKMFRGIF